MTRYLAIIFVLHGPDEPHRIIRLPIFRRTRISPPKPLAAASRFQWLDFFPTFQQVQEGILKKSLVGPVIADKLGLVLINGGPAPTQKLAAKPH